MARLRSAAPWAALVVVAGVGAWGWLRPAPAPLVTRERTVLWQHRADIGDVGFGLAIAPDGNTIVYVDTVGGTRQLWAKERDRVEATALAGTNGAGGPVFSPDGQWIAFVADGKVKRVPRLGGSAITVADSANNDLPVVAWLDDGTILFDNPTFNLQAISVDGGAQRRVFSVEATGRGIVSATPLPGGRGALIVACTFGCPEMDLRALDLRTDSARVLTEDVLKAWFLPGGIVAFVRKDGGVFSAPFDLDRLAFRASPVPVLDGVRAGQFTVDMAVSPSGMLLYVAGSAQSAGTPNEAVWVTRQGVATRVDTSWAFVPASNGGIALSPDGRRLAVSIRTSGSEDIWVKELDRGPLTRLTFEGSNWRPEWTADSRSVMYISIKPRANADVRARRADGTGTETTLLDAARAVFEVARTPDTTRLVVRFGQPPTRDIFLLTRGRDSAATSPLVADGGFEEVSPALSRDGRWLAYASNESGRYEVYVRPFPDANAGRWQVSRNGGSEPGWAHSGRELFYRDGSGAVVAVAVNPGSAFAIGDQHVLFPATGLRAGGSHREWDITADDRRFVFTRAVAAETAANPAATQLIQVEHWLAELRAGSRGRP